MIVPSKLRRSFAEMPCQGHGEESEVFGRQKAGESYGAEEPDEFPGQ